jgi:hypothetical protein
VENLGFVRGSRGFLMKNENGKGRIDKKRKFDTP